MDGITFNVNFSTNGAQVLGAVNNALDNVQSNVKKTTKTFGDCYKSLLAVGLAVAVIFIACRHADHPCKN